MAKKVANKLTGKTGVEKTVSAKNVSGGEPGNGAAAAGRLTITLVRSPIGFNRTQAATVRGMGLRRIRHSVELPDTPETRGMILKVRHLITVQE